MKIQYQADDFFNAYSLLEENNKVFFNKTKDSSEKSKLESVALGTYPIMSVGIVCLAFSVELYIKNLHFMLKGKVPRGHNILKLFEKLPKNIQQEIFDCDSISQNPFCTQGDIFSAKRFTSSYSAYDRFIDQIKAISNGFEKWRYSYESKCLKYDIYFALALIEAIKSVCNNADKKGEN